MTRSNVGGRARAGSIAALTIAASALLLAAFGPTPSHGQDALRARGALRVEPPASPAVIAVVRGLRSERGHVRGGLYGSQSTFTHGGQEVATCSTTITNGVARCRFESVPAGRFAIGMMHDEDDDTVFDQGFMGVPEEGYGFSRDARGTLGAPSFDSAAFDYDGRSVRSLSITMRYGI
ncbi:DUF2141 domain-containing protein [Sandaracinus amylolyticus]|uniref:DUF2141 domain-containing protein n=1 Tax=Sandaracinus amylolyticus TaxID=927083 RepID=UPI001F462468|nr:DUF2141 domain-containing protein [Sandaracinus amylolyticus]